jgi:hypothetical protein
VALRPGFAGAYTFNSLLYLCVKNRKGARRMGAGGKNTVNKKEEFRRK